MNLMRIIYSLLFLIIISSDHLNAQSCSPSGNVMVFANYDGGVLNINVDVNITNLKIGVCTYEPVVINLTGPFAASVKEVIRAGYPNTNNNHCGGILASAINGPTPSNYTMINIPPVTLTNPNGYNSGIICAYNCNTTTTSGGCNTIDQVIDYFITQFNGSLYSVTTQYCCWQSTNSFSVSSLSNSCCIGPNPTASIAYSASPYCQSVAAAQPVTFSGDLGGTYSASPSGLTINSSTGEITPGTSLAGTYTVTYTILGCPNTTATASVEITSGTASAISYPADEFCSSAAVQNVTLTGPTGGIFSANSTGLSLDTLTGAVSPSSSSAGNYIVTYTPPPSGSCGSAALDTIQILALTTSSFSTSICQGASYTFGSQTLDSTGVYSETFPASNGCDSVVTLNLSVNSLPAPSLDLSDSLICAGDSSRICAPSGYISYQWNTGQQDSCIYARSAGNYYVTVMDANNCFGQSQAKSVGAHLTPAVSISVKGDTLSAFNSLSYQWYLNNVLIAGAEDSVYVATVSGSYQVIVTDSNGCRATSTAVPVVVTGVIDPLSEDLKVYPNPMENGHLHFETGAGLLGTQFEIFNSTGQVIYKSIITARQFEIDLIAAQGVYYLHLRSQHNTLVKKLTHL